MAALMPGDDFFDANIYENHRKNIISMSFLICFLRFPDPRSPQKVGLSHESGHKPPDQKSINLKLKIFRNLKLKIVRSEPGKREPRSLAKTYIPNLI